MSSGLSCCSLTPGFAVSGATLAGAADAQETPPAKEWPASARRERPDWTRRRWQRLDADLASGKYGLVDSMLVIRCGKQAFERSYARDYDKIYGERAKKTGPLNHDLDGPYNYFSTEFHPYYQAQRFAHDAVRVEDGYVHHYRLGHARAGSSKPIWTRRS